MAIPAAISDHHKLGVGDTTGTQWTEARDATLRRTNPHNKTLSDPKDTMAPRLRNYDLDALSPEVSRAHYIET